MRYSYDPTPTFRPSDFLIFPIILVLYLLGPLHFPSFPNTNELSRLYALFALLDTGRPEIDSFMTRYGSAGDYAELNGHQYSEKAPGHILLSLPILAALKFVGMEAPPAKGGLDALRFALAATVNLLPGVLFLAAFLKVALRWGGNPIWVRLMTALLALGTGWFPYSFQFMSHQTATILFAGAGWAAARGKFGLGGLLAGVSVCSDYLVAPLLAPLGLYVLMKDVRTPRGRWLWFPALLPGLAAVLAWNKWCFGSYWTVGYHYVNPARFMEVEPLTSVAQVGFPSPFALISLLFSPQMGLLFFSPFLIFALPGFLRLLGTWSKRKEAVLAAGVFLVNWGSISCLGIWPGGWALGPRYLLFSLPWLILLACAAMEGTHGRFYEPPVSQVMWGTGLALGFVAVVFYGLGSLTFPQLAPEVGRNPWFEMIWPLVKRGWNSSLLGGWLGLYGWRIFDVWVIGALACLGLVLAGGEIRGHPRIPTAFAAVLTAGGLLYGASHLLREHSAEKYLVQAEVFQGLRFPKGAWQRFDSLVREGIPDALRGRAVQVAAWLDSYPLKPEDFEALHPAPETRGMYLLAAGRAAEERRAFDEARDWYVQARLYLPESPEAAFHEGRMALQTKDLEGARQAFDEARKLGLPSEETAAPRAAMALINGEVCEALDLLAPLLDKRPDDPYGWFLYGQAQEKLGNQAEAGEAYLKASSGARPFPPARKAWEALEK